MLFSYFFYEGIDKYARSNHIYPSQCEFGNFYKVRLNEIGFKIGISFIQGTKFFCKKVPVESEKEFIDFNDIMTDKNQEQIDLINASLDSLSNMILTIYESGVPIELIAYIVENTIKEITYQKKYNVKSLIKK